MRKIVIRCIVDILFAAAIFSAPTLGNAESKADQNSIIAQYQRLNNDFTDFSSEFYRSLTASRQFQIFHNANILAEEAAVLLDQGKTQEGIALVFENKKLIRHNINSKAIISIVSSLLQANEFNEANNILKLANQESDPSLISNIQFAFANYYYKHNDWQKTIDLVEKIANDLPAHDYQSAMFMEGMSLQALLKHRKAIEIYKKIDKNSEYFTLAQINMAVSDFRQDWWTDAQDIINALLKIPRINKDQVLTDRLHTIIGYSFLQLEYFRNSRDAFRNVSLNTEYTNQALLGIALDAAYQNDYVGALNAAKVLKNRSGTDLEIDEAHLLLPYFYEKLQQHATASAGYTSAIKYYEGRLQSLNTVLQSPLAEYKQALQNNKIKVITLKNTDIRLDKALPPSYFEQARLLKQYRMIVSKLHETSLSAKFSALSDKFAEIAMKVAQQELRIKSGYMTDYMNQCRYGLARMFDNSKNTQE